MYLNIPAEMRGLVQWIVWRYDKVPNQAKLTKVPYTPGTYNKAAVDNPSTWRSFQDAVDWVTNTGNFHGVGFVFTEHDPYVFVDLDALKDKDGNKLNLPDILARQMGYLNQSESYNEISPSGEGLHIILKGKLPGKGRKRDFIEIYDKLRYATFTGHVFIPSPEGIVENQPLVELIWNDLAGGTESIDYSGVGDMPQTQDDLAIWNMAAGAANADKFLKLYNGDWQSITKTDGTPAYTSQSEADFAIVDIFAYYTYNREQVVRLFHLSALGQRDKAKRQDYLDKMVKAAEDRRLPPIDSSGLRDQFAAMSAAPDAPEPPMPIPVNHIPEPEPPPLYNSADQWEYPPGMLGEIAQYIYEAAPRPVKQIALVGAIGMMAGIVGKAWNVSGTGLNQYIMLVAPTGTGKEAMASGMDKLFNAVMKEFPKAIEFIGPGNLASEQALVKQLGRTSCFVTVVGEFGHKMQQMASKYASSNEVGLKRMYLDLYNKSGYGQTLKPTVYSDKDKNTTTVLSPAFTMIGETTPSTLYNALTEELIADGLLPRFTLLEYVGQRPALNKQHNQIQPPADLVTRVAQLATYSCAAIVNMSVKNVTLTPEAEAISDAFDKYADSQINATGAEVNRHLWNRAHIKVLKLAALVAVGINPAEPVIGPQCIEWAARIVDAEVRALLGKFERGEVGKPEESESEQVQYVREKIYQYMTSSYDQVVGYNAKQSLHTAGIIEYSYISKRTANIALFKNDRAGATVALNRAIKFLCETDDMRDIPKPVMIASHGTAARAFVVQHPEHFKPRKK